MLARLGLAADRAVIPHLDDLGGSPGANHAFLALARAGHLTCGSVMVPAPWFHEVADAVAADPVIDIGVHLTLTSEWDTPRWAPLSTRSPASGLVDQDGCFWRDVGSVRRHLVPEAAEAELRAQVERAIAAGLRPTHIDAHMGAAMLPELLDVHMRLGREYGLFPVLPRSIGWAPDPAAYRAATAALDGEGRPVVDHCRGTLPVEPARLREAWAQVIADLPPGLTHLALHATDPGADAAMPSDHAGWRRAEFGFLQAGGLSVLCEQAGVVLVGTRAVQRLWNETPA